MPKPKQREQRHLGIWIVLELVLVQTMMMIVVVENAGPDQMLVMYALGARTDAEGVLLVLESR